MKVDGQCHCGRITFTAEIDPEQVRICNCTDCQSLSGAPFRTTAPVPEGAFELLTGEPKIYVKTAESGRKRAQSFCGDCGSPIYATSVGDGSKIFGIRLGTIRQRHELVPRKQYWSRSALPWLAGLNDIPREDRQ